MSELKATFLLMGPWLRELTASDPVQRHIADTFLAAIKDHLSAEEAHAAPAPMIKIPVSVAMVLDALDPDSRKPRKNDGATVLSFPTRPTGDAS